MVFCAFQPSVHVSLFDAPLPSVMVPERCRADRSTARAQPTAPCTAHDPSMLMSAPTKRAVPRTAGPWCPPRERQQASTGPPRQHRVQRRRRNGRTSWTTSEIRTNGTVLRHWTVPSPALCRCHSIRGKSTFAYERTTRLVASGQHGGRRHGSSAGPARARADAARIPNAPNDTETRTPTTTSSPTTVHSKTSARGRCSTVSDLAVAHGSFCAAT